MIETERLNLRDWRAGDDEAFARHLNTPAVMRWLGGVLAPDRVDEATGRYRRWQAEHGYTFWIVERPAAQEGADAEWLGFCGLKRADALGSSVPGACEIGWRFREDAWGKGYAREAAAASLAYAFDTLGEDRVVAVTVPGNAASWGLMLRLGMHHRPDLDYPDPRYGPELNPAIIHEITRDAWTAQT